MLLAIDVGNTNTVLGVFDEKKLCKYWRVFTERHKTSDEYGLLLKMLLQDARIEVSSIDNVIISSVVPPITTILVEAMVRYFNIEPVVVGPGIKTGINIKYDNPHEVGADRIVNAVAAYRLYGGPIVVVDFGTATTFCAISERGEYLGGVIAPGIGISTEALFDHTAKLPRVELIKPKKAIGRNTVESMQSGIVLGFVGQVSYIVKRMKEEFAADARVIATGGLARLIASECTEIDEINPLLTLQGLKYLADMNKK